MNDENYFDSEKWFQESQRRVKGGDGKEERPRFREARVDPPKFSVGPAYRSTFDTEAQKRIFSTMMAGSFATGDTPAAYRHDGPSDDSDESSTTVFFPVPGVLDGGGTGFDGGGGHSGGGGASGSW